MLTDLTIFVKLYHRKKDPKKALTGSKKKNSERRRSALQTTKLNGHVKTSDLYYGAYLLSSGGRIEAIQVALDGSKKVSFQFSGSRIQELTREYLSGEATVNLRELKSSLKHLKDIIYQEAKSI